ncbi:unnamed protein product [Fraxinus pennsylvanica]|uniref:Exocyst complex component Sec10 N-terminal domain-containing protein n=1 Tax=Fraxinus pennsylvanica TaxID=56036 RepID=A0AAD1Z708_9LAMI|nr:unnamed protein product [Fraxinus pennsylvanica]
MYFPNLCYPLNHLSDSDACPKIDRKLYSLKKEVSAQDSKNRKTLSQIKIATHLCFICVVVLFDIRDLVPHNAKLEKGVDGLFGSFARLDSRISSVGQTAAKIGDHLQMTIRYLMLLLFSIKIISLISILLYLMEFNSSPGDLMEISPLFSDDSRVAEAASIAKKLRSFAEEDFGRQGMVVSSAVGNATASHGLEVAVASFLEYCNSMLIC